MLALVLIGLSAGILSGLFGSGGGVLIVPSLILMAKFQARAAIGTSLGALLLPVSLLGAYTYYQSGNLDVRASIMIGVGLFFGAWAGARLSLFIPLQTLQRLFAVFLVMVAIRVWHGAGAP